MINASRLLQILDELRGFGRREHGVVRRFLTDVDMNSRHWLADKMRSAGLDAEIDGVGNVYGRSPNPGPALLLGSHSDTQPTGGWLDGALGVIYAIEVVQALRENDATRDLAIDAISFADEEAHYLGLLGSRSFCGELRDDEIDAARNEAGQSLRDALYAHGLDSQPRARLERRRYAAFVEAHIEQGPWLERRGLRLGVVTSIVGMRDLTLTFHGQQNHAGTTPMVLRRDAARRLFEFAVVIDAAFAEIAGEHTVWTIGRIELVPNAPSIVPGLALANLQFRDPDQDLVERLQQRAFELAEEFDARREVRVEIGVRDASARAMPLDSGVQQAIAAAAEAQAPGAWMHMPSGAAHDAQVVAAHLPAGMLFIPSIGGISHDFAEDSLRTDIVLGCEVLADAAVRLLRAANA